MDLSRSGRMVKGAILPDLGVWLNRGRCLFAAAALLVTVSPPLLAQPMAQQAGSAALPARAPATVAQRIEQALHASAGNGAAPASAESAVVRLFYYTRAYQPLWTSSARAGELIAAVEASAAHGLTPADFALDALREAAARSGDDGSAIVRRELLFTDAAARLARQLRYGKVDPARLYVTWNFSPLPGVRERAESLAELLAADSLQNAFAALAPQGDAYRGLQQALARYTALAAQGEWPRVPGGPTLRPGERDGRIATLRQRLQAEGWIAGARKGAARADSERYDQDLVAAMKGFQRAHGLAADAAVGAQTLAALNVGVAERVAQIRANLERQRWVARDLGGDHLLVDIAGYHAELVVGGELLWSSRVVVGRPERQTPELLDQVHSLVVNPKWVVPPTILREDVIPKVMVNTAYLDKQRMRVVDNRGRAVAATQVDWSGAQRGGFPYQIVQESGDKGALGRLKFSLGNGYAIYLHDTPSRAQFGKSARALSSGCVRLEKPRDLALLLLADGQRWSADALATVIDSGRTQTLAVGLQVPVMLLYRTAVAATLADQGDQGDQGDQSHVPGGVFFRADIYDHDRPLIALLAAAGSPPP